MTKMRKSRNVPERRQILMPGQNLQVIISEIWGLNVFWIEDSWIKRHLSKYLVILKKV